MLEDIKRIKDGVDRNIKGMVLNSVYDYGNKYLISIAPKEEKNDEFLMDPFYTVEKKTFKLSGFSPRMDPDGFSKAMKNKLYTRTKE